MMQKKSFYAKKLFLHICICHKCSLNSFKSIPLFVSLYIISTFLEVRLISVTIKEHYYIQIIINNQWATHSLFLIVNALMLNVTILTSICPQITLKVIILIYYELIPYWSLEKFANYCLSTERLGISALVYLWYKLM